MSNKLYEFAQKIFPLNRSLTGVGVRATLAAIQEVCPKLKTYSVSSGTKVFDWVVPLEWQVDEAYIQGPNGNKFCDFKVNNLHLVGYSEFIETTLELKELNKHLYSLPNQPTAIPYVTSYYAQNWGFCISEEDRLKLPNGLYKVVIKGKKFVGEMNYAELVIKGKSSKEVFFSTYICHPSMANNEVSGITVATYLGDFISKMESPYYTYRILFIPETIGSLYYLSKKSKHMKHRIVAGFNITCIGDENAYSFLPSRSGDTLSDKIGKHVLQHLDINYKQYTWSDRGSDERQYCAPGIDLPIASIMRSKYGEYPEYHTSLDKLGSVVTAQGLNGGLSALKLIVECLELNIYPCASFLGEPQLSKHGLYPEVGIKSLQDQARKVLDILTWADGQHSILDIAEKMGCFALDLKVLVGRLVDSGLIKIKR